MAVSWGKGVLWVATLGVLLPLTAPAAAYPRPETVERVSVSSTGAQANADSGWTSSGAVADMGVAMTPDARYVAFASAASDLVPGDTNGLSDVFVRDRRTGTTRIASVPSAGTGLSQGVAPPTAVGLCTGSGRPAISANGRYVAFSSCDFNLTGLGNDLNLAEDVFVHDMQTGSTTMVSVTSDGHQSNLAAASSTPSISADGRFVVFESRANNFACTAPTPAVGCDDPTAQFAPFDQVYLHDMKTGRTTIVSVADSGAAGDGASIDPVISADGRDVVFVSDADNLVGNDHNFAPTDFTATPSAPDVYVRDLRAKTTTLVSVALTGQAGSGAVPVSGEGGSRTVEAVGISGDDRYVVFGSSAVDLVPNAPAGGIFVRDLVAKRTQRVSVSSAGQSRDGVLANGACGNSDDVSISYDGRFAAFPCDPDPSDPACADTQYNQMVYDRLVGSLDPVAFPNRAPNCSDVANDNRPQLSSHGDFVAFASAKTKLVGGDTNKAYDVFVVHRGSYLGAGNFGSGRVTVAGDPALAGLGVLSRGDATGDADAAFRADGTDLIGASVVSRPSLHDLFVRLAVAQMPMFALANPAVVYGFDLTVNGTSFEVRAAKTVTGGAAFGLFRRTGSGQWLHVTDLQGGYGTTGEEVVFALPLAAIGAGHGGRVRDLRGFTAIGSYQTGAAALVDQIALAS